MSLNNTSLGGGSNMSRAIKSLSEKRRITQNKNNESTPSHQLPGGVDDQGTVQVSGVRRNSFGPYDEMHPHRRTRTMLVSEYENREVDQHRNTVVKTIRRRTASAVAAAAGTATVTSNQKMLDMISGSESSQRSTAKAAVSKINELPEVASTVSGSTSGLDERQLEAADGPSLTTHLPDVVVLHNQLLPVPNQIRMQVGHWSGLYDDY